MFDMFKAHWTKATHFRTLMFKWQLIFLLAVDIMLIIIGIIGLLMIYNGVVTQLIITMVETIILSIYLIVLGIIEKCYIVPIFDYTENQQSMITSEGMKGYDKKKGRKLQMNNLLLKVKNSSSAAFKDNKLSDLL
jgi:membrane protein YdbS with pleckstrin-like domain